MKVRRDDPPKPSPQGAPEPTRFPLDSERDSRTVKFRLQQELEDESIRIVKGYFTVGLYTDGTPGDVFIFTNKEGDDIYGFARCWSIAVSMLLQHGVHPQKIYDEFKHRDFQPNGICGVDGVPIAKSMVDMVVRWMELKLPPTAREDTEEDENWMGMVEEVRALQKTPEDDE